MKIAMADRRTMVKHHAARYQRARKGEKTQILELFVKATGYRTYAARLLHGHGRRVWLRPGLAAKGDIGIRGKRSRPRVCGPEVQEALKEFWNRRRYRNRRKAH